MRLLLTRLLRRAATGGPLVNHYAYRRQQAGPAAGRRVLAAAHAFDTRRALVSRELACERQVLRRRAPARVGDRGALLARPTHASLTGSAPR
jgi:hypothetical protein